MDKKEISQYLVVRLADGQFAFNLAHAVEIIDPRKAISPSTSTTSLPKHIDYENGRIPIIDLGRHLHNEEHHTLMDAIVVVTECDGEKAAVLVDSADEILRLDPDGTPDMKLVADDSVGDLIEARLHSDDRNIPVINLSGLYKLSGVVI